MTYTYRFSGYFESGGVGKAGIAVTIDVYKRGDGSLVVNNQNAIEIAGGFYKYDYATSELDDYLPKFKTADTTVDATQVAGMISLEIQRIDEAVSNAKTLTAAYDAAKTAASQTSVTAIPTNPLLTTDARLDDLDATISSRMPATQSALVTVTGPVAIGGNIALISGDDYYNADGRALEWSSTTWPDLTGAAVVFKSGETEIAMTVVTSGEDISQTVRLELSKIQSEALEGTFLFEVEAELVTSEHVTSLVIASGVCE